VRGDDNLGHPKRRSRQHVDLTDNANVADLEKDLREGDT
jgi:hypothetical protein